MSDAERKPDTLEEKDNFLKKFGVTPEAAMGRIVALFPSTMDEASIQHIKENFRSGMTGSHEVRALLRIAEGTEIRLLGDVYSELRVEDGLPPTRL